MRFVVTDSASKTGRRAASIAARLSRRISSPTTSAGDADPADAPPIDKQYAVVAGVDAEAVGHTAVPVVGLLDVSDTLDLGELRICGSRGMRAGIL